MVNNFSFALFEQAEKKYEITGKIRIGIFPGGGKNPGTVMPTKRWPAENFRALSEKLAAAGATVYAFGGTIDSDVLDVLRDVKGLQIIDTNLKDFAYYVSMMDLFIAGDTGPIHVAAALGVKTLGLYGPSSPEVFGPRNPGSVNIWKKTECAPCYEPETVHAKKFLECADNKCMQAISVQDVKNAADQLLAGNK